MKKNRMMRLASALLVAVLLTTCAISGTFAKYVTTASATDTARVAKWGVDIDVTGDSLFNNQYDITAGGAITVRSKDDAKVVAPGTSSEKMDSTGLRVKISGTPEVATEITFDFVASNDIFLKKGTYFDGTTGKADDKYTFSDADYYPVVFTLKENGDSAPAVTGKLSDIEAYINSLTFSASPNVDIGYYFDLTWEWDFGDAANNMKDTTLGNLAAGTAEDTTLVSGTDYNLEIDYELIVTVEQVD